MSKARAEIPYGVPTVRKRWSWSASGTRLRGDL